MHVTRSWVDGQGFCNAQMTCYGCESWGGSHLDARSANQSWIWSLNAEQKTGSDDEGLNLLMHRTEVCISILRRGKAGQQDSRANRNA